MSLIKVAEISVNDIKEGKIYGRKIIQGDSRTLTLITIKYDSEHIFKEDFIQMPSNNEKGINNLFQQNAIQITPEDENYPKYKKILDNKNEN